MEQADEKIMARCLQLAALGAGRVAPNPVVGAVLVHEGRIIGEGYHERYGGAHAEVNCLNSVKEADKPLIPASTLYVSLEPCAHYGKTPPCADLIIRERIPEVVVGCIDPFAQVAGKGIERLKNAGMKVVAGVLEAGCRRLNRRFFTFHGKKRPYIILKWAQTREGFLSAADGRPLKISNAYSSRLVHRWRSEEAAILVGVNTVIQDDPLLTNRLWSGPSPLRIILDPHLRTPATVRLLKDETAPVWILNTAKDEKRSKVEWIRLSEKDFLEETLKVLYERDIQSVLVEGGTHTLQAFLDAGHWDEARVITGAVNAPSGRPAPVLSGHAFSGSFEVHGDEVAVYVSN